MTRLLRDHRLWVTVGLVAVLAIAWQVPAALLDHPLTGTTTTLLPLGIFLVPVLYASVTFGLGGGLVLAIVSAVATVPWALGSLSHQYTLGAWFDLAQVLVLVLVAYFVGRGVRDERRAREAAERSRQDHLLAEIRYRDLFDTNSQPILLADVSGVVHEANVAAEELFGPPAGATLAELLGTGAFEALQDGTAGAGPVAMVELPGRSDGSPAAVYRPASRLVELDGQPMLQVVLQDVTEDARRRQRAQAYAADVLRGQEDERRRIAQELHDGPLQALVHLCRLIDAAAAGGAAAAAGAGGVAEVRGAAESVVTEVRRIARGLRPPLLDDLGLVAALQRLADDVELRAGVAARLRVPGPLPPLLPAAELTVYRIVQEALSNVDRHAGATSVEVTLWAADGWLQLRVADDGAGFDPATVGSGGTLGLAGMVERAGLVGGTLQVRSQPGEGTVAAAAFPLAGVTPGGAGEARPGAVSPEAPGRR
jgi:signal transduction histidine kinase